MNKTKRPNAILYLVFPVLVVIVLAIILTIVLYKIDIESLKIQQKSEFSEILSSIQTEVDTEVFTTISLKSFFLASKDVTQEEFQAFAESIYQETRRQGKSITLEWVDEESVVRYVYPLDPINEKAVNFDNKPFPNRMIPIIKAKESKDIVITEPIELVQGYPGVVIYAPIYDVKDIYKGCAIAVIKLEDITRNISKETKVKYKAQIQTDNNVFSLFGQDIYRLNGLKVPSVMDPEETGEILVLNTESPTLIGEINFADRIWRLFFEPDYPRLATERMSLYGIVTSVFMLLAIGIIFLNYRGKVQTIDLFEKEIKLRKDLEIEIDKRRLYEQKINEQVVALEKAKQETQKSYTELKQLNELMLGREIKMIELKKQMQKGSDN